MNNEQIYHAEISKQLSKLDDQLYTLVSDIDILEAVTPINYKDQRQRFLESNYSVNPDFIYNDHQIETFKRKRALFNLPIDELQDEDLFQIYSDVIESYVDKIDQYLSIGTPEFIYDSLRYFGEPSSKDISNAQFILHLPDDPSVLEEPLLNSQEIAATLESFAQREGYSYQIKIDDGLIANALVSGTTVKINSNVETSLSEVQALAHHELGVHLVTTLNARNQPLRLLSLGSPVNTMTQEGMAILSEYMAGFMTLPRLKVLALRVLAVDSMIREREFKRTFLLLKESYGIADQQAFTITARVYRGGGFTKDYLYLRGLHQVLHAYETQPDFQYLLCGKVSESHLSLVSRLINKGLLYKPKYITPSFRSPVENNAISQFIAHAIK